MHSLSFNTEVSYSKDGGDLFVAAATLVTEGRIPGQSDSSKSKKFYEGPHCTLIKGTDPDHKCDITHLLCQKFDSDRETILNLYQKGVPLCIEVLFTCSTCKEINNTEADNLDNAYLLEQWHFSVSKKRDAAPLSFNLNQLVSAIRSQLYFSQITAWLTTQDNNSEIPIIQDNLKYRISAPGELLAPSKFTLTATKHEFPIADLGNGFALKVSFFSAPRHSSVPEFTCSCNSKTETVQPETNMEMKNGLFDDRMHTLCNLKGKHRCEDLEDNIIKTKNHYDLCNNKKICQNVKKESSTTNGCEPSSSKPKLRVNIEHQPFSVSYVCEKRNISSNTEKQSKSAKLEFGESTPSCCSNTKYKNDLNGIIVQDKSKMLLDAIERSGHKGLKNGCRCVQSACDNANCDMSESDIFSIKEKNKINVYKHCDSPTIRQNIMREMKLKRRTSSRQHITFDDENSPIKSDDTPHNNLTEVPSFLEQANFRKNLDNATSMVFHSRTGLPLTSSPAPARKGKSRFEFDSSLNSVSAIKSALFSNGFSTDDESESDGSLMSPCSPELYAVPKKDLGTVKYRRKGHAANLLGSFEESVLNGRLEPVSTVHGFRAELGASGSFVPKHMFVPVTVFFYTLGDNDKVSSPYLGHINLGKKGYNVPKSGTVQVTLFNPLGTVVKMFVIMYDLSDMPPNSQTFIRQRTLYMPTNCKDANLEWGPKWLRYLVHLRFMTSKSGKVYLHSDIRMIIFRKCDMDTATAHSMDMSYEPRSFTHMPANPRFSPRK